jgi:hypothetical protein
VGGAVRQRDIVARFRYVTGMLKAISPIITDYVAEGGSRQRLVDLIDATFRDQDADIEAKIASARD